MGIHLPKQPTFAQEQFYTAMGGHQPSNNNTHIQYNRVQRILDLGDGNVWILTSHMGLFVYNTTDQIAYQLGAQSIETAHHCQQQSEYHLPGQRRNHIHREFQTRYFLL
ncbi:hypothetical protein NIB75_03335 [Bacteroides uniformis]|nr:hypothetical protein [Bacteroides uniformis]